MAQFSINDDYLSKGQASSYILNIGTFDLEVNGEILNNGEIISI